MLAYRSALAAGLAGALVALATTARAVDPAVQCESSKLKESGKYAMCLLKAESKAVKDASVADVSTCDTKFTDKFTKAEGKADPGVCPTEGDAAQIAGEVKAFGGNLALQLKNPPGFLGKGRVDTPGTIYWRDTHDGVQPFVGGCHQGYTADGCANGMEMPGTLFGELCATYNGMDVLVETDPGLNECHKHKVEKKIDANAMTVTDVIYGSPPLFDCDAACIAIGSPHGACVPLPNHCPGNIASAKCQCFATTTSTAATTTTTTSLP